MERACRTVGVPEMRQRVSGLAGLWLGSLLALLSLLGGGVVAAAEVTGEAWQRGSGETVEVVARLQIPDGFYLYHTVLGDSRAIGMPLVGVVPGYVIEGLATSAPHEKTQPLFDGSGKSVPVQIHTGSMELFLRLRRLPDAGASVRLVLQGQSCNEAQCLPMNLLLEARPADGDAGKLFTRFPARDALSPLPATWVRFAAKAAKATAESAAAEGQGASGRESGSTPAPAKRGGVRGANVLAEGIGALSVGGSAPAPEAQKPVVSTPALNPASFFTDSGAGFFQTRGEGESYALPVWLGLALLAGLLLNFMPCVLPVVSLKLISFVNQAREDRRRLIGLSLSFSAGMIAVFLVLAALAIGVGLHWGEQFQTEAFNIALAALVFAFSLSFFGVYEFGVPDPVNRLQSGQALPREGYAGAFFTGALATLLATPCSGPFLGATLSWALAQPPLTVVLVFFCLGLGMALPYVVLTAVPALRSWMPKPGAWMVTFRQLMGFALLLTVVYLLIFLRPENFLPVCGLFVGVAFACWLLGRYAGFTASAGRRWLIRALAAGGIAGAVFLAFGPLKSFTGGQRGGDVAWLPFEETRFLSDLQNGKHVFVDFTADWCPNCKYNEFVVFNSDAVRAKFREKGVVVYQADITDDNPQTARLRALLKNLGGSAIPFAAVFPAGEARTPYLLPDVLTAGAVLDVLNRLPDPVR